MKQPLITPDHIYAERDYTEIMQGLDIGWQSICDELGVLYDYYWDQEEELLETSQRNIGMKHTKDTAILVASLENYMKNIRDLLLSYPGLFTGDESFLIHDELDSLRQCINNGTISPQRVKDSPIGYHYMNILYRANMQSLREKSNFLIARVSQNSTGVLDS